MQVQGSVSRGQRRVSGGYRRIVVALAAAAVSAVLAACSGGSAPAPKQPVAASSVAPDDGVGADPALRAAPMHGLVVVTKQWLTTPPPNVRLWVVGYDPGTGAPTATRYFFPAAGETLAFTEDQQAPYQRQAFARDYTLTSVTSGRQDGVTNAGVVHSGDSVSTWLSKRAVAANGTPSSAQAGWFNPRTGRLWFTRDGGTLASVDPVAGSASESPEKGAVQTWGGGISWFGFGPDGFGPVWNTTLVGGRVWYLPGGQMMFGDSTGFVFGKQGTVGPKSRPVVPLPKGVRGYPVATIDATRFVLVDVAGTNLFVVARSGKKLTALPLPSAPGGQILGAVVSPQHDQVAYRSSDGNLYVVALTGRTPPRKVVGVPYGLNDRKSMLVDWLP